MKAAEGYRLYSIPLRKRAKGRCQKDHYQKRNKGGDTAEVTAITFSNGLKLKGITGVSFKIEPYEINNSNVGSAINSVHVKSKDNAVKGLTCTFANDLGLSTKPKKISPKMAAYNASTKEVTFTGCYKGTISANLIGL